MKHKLFLLIFSISLLSILASGSVVLASSGTCPTDNGLGVVCSGVTPYYCLSTCMAPSQCTPTWVGTGVCANGVNCPLNCSGSDSCGYCNACSGSRTLCGSYPSQTCKDNVTIAHCISYNQCQSKCTACAAGYTLSTNGLQCLGATLNLGTDSVGAGGYIFQSTAPALTLDSSSVLSLVSSGKFGIGTDSPNKQLHIYNTSENAEINIQSITGSGNHWGIYNDRTTNDLRFWGGNISGDILTIQRDGKIKASSLATAGTYCLQADNTGLISKTDSACGGTGGSLTGGTTNYIPIWNSASTMGTSTIYQGLNGNVVIGGTTSSSYKLYVAGSQYVSGSVVANVDGVFLGGDIYDTTDNLMISAEDNLYLNMDYNGNDDNTRSIVFSKNAGINSTPTPDNELMRITESGRVGVGTTNPQNELHIYNSSSGPIVNLEGDFSSQYQGIRIGDKDNSNMEKWFMGSNNTGGNYVIRRKSSASVSTNDLFIDYATGNITLATTTVSGSLNIRPLCDGTSNALRTDSSGNVICGTITATGGTGVNASGTQNWATYWTGTNTLGSEQYLSVSRGGTGKGTLTGVLKGSGTGAFTAMTGSANYLTKWSDANTITHSNIYLTTTSTGIGVTSPISSLHIKDDTFGPIIALQGADNRYRGLRIGDASNNEKWFVGASSTEFVIRRTSGSTGYNDLMLKSGGELQINVPTTIGTNKIQKGGANSGSMEFDSSGNLIITIP